MNGGKKVEKFPLIVHLILFIECSLHLIRQTMMMMIRIDQVIQREREREQFIMIIIKVPAQTRQSQSCFEVYCVWMCNFNFLATSQSSSVQFSMAFSLCLQKLLWLLTTLWTLAMSFGVNNNNNNKIDPEIEALLKKAKTDIAKLDPKKLMPTCKKG